MPKTWSLLIGMKQLAAMVSLFAAAVVAAVVGCEAVFGQTSNNAGAVVVSGWSGGCSVSRIADLTCMMRREVRSAAGERLGVVAFGEEQSSRFLFVGVELGKVANSKALVAEIDGKRLVKGDVACRGGDTFCSATIAVDGALLKKLLSAHLLTVVDRSSKKILLSVPLDGFAQVHAYSL
jgi:invasion protein IalB